MKTQLLLQLQMLLGSFACSVFFPQVVSWRQNLFWIQLTVFLHFETKINCYPKSYEKNLRRRFLFQKWVFLFPLQLMILTFRACFTGMQLLFSIVAHLHLLSTLRYSVAFLMQLLSNIADWRVLKAVSGGYLGYFFWCTHDGGSLAEVKVCIVL